METVSSFGRSYRCFVFISILIFSLWVYYASVKRFDIVSTAPKSTPEVSHSFPQVVVPKTNYVNIPFQNQTVTIPVTSTTLIPSTYSTSEPVKPPSTHVPITETPSIPTAVLIVTAKRSGSSFVGELFNQHPEVFYVYEPLWALDQAALKSSALNKSFVETSIAILNGTFHCDFHTAYPKQVLQKNSHFSYKNSKLPHTHPFASVSPSEREEVCQKYKLVVAKVIRVHDLNDIQPLLASSDIEVRVIHLVRDPRPTERSRRRTRPNFNLIRRKGTDENDEDDLCLILEQNLKFWKNTPGWLNGKYRMVRFEDIAASPQKLAEELYEFVGLRKVDKITEWIKKNTEPQNPKSFQFSTTKNSAEVLHAWRRDMSWTFIDKIQRSCLKPMEALGYVVFPDLKSLQDLDIPSTRPLQDL